MTSPPARLAGSLVTTANYFREYAIPRTRVNTREEGSERSNPVEALPLLADVPDRTSLEEARDVLFARWERLDILVSAAGGNVPAATVAENATFFGLAAEPLREVFDLNLLGSILPSPVFGEAMARGQSSEVEGSM